MLDFQRAWRSFSIAFILSRGLTRSFTFWPTVLVAIVIPARVYGGISLDPTLYPVVIPWRLACSVPTARRRPFHLPSHLTLYRQLSK